jgi:LacI family transcriptional regulator
MNDIPKVALLIETARSYGRGLLRGIVRYARLHGPWSFYVTPGDFEQAVPRLESWGGTGVIARIETPRMAEALLASRLPLIALDLSETQLSPDGPLAKLCEVRSDSHQAARLAAEHLLERGFRHHAFVGIAGRVWSARRQEGFVERIRETGGEPEVYEPPQSKRDREWGREQTRMAQWLRRLPKPVGLLACNDDRGRQVLEACRAAGLRVPEEVAVVGVDNDELLCDLSDPPLSSVALNSERGGYEAAALLDEMMRGHAPRCRQILVEPQWVVARRSTEVDALDDPEVAAALRFIHDRTGCPIQVGDVVRSLALSRRGLEMRFRKALGRSMRAEIERVHLDRAQRLLLETDLSMPKIAEASGFASASYFGAVFRRRMGMTPAKFRARTRGC